MNPKSLILLEFHKVLERLKAYASFELSEKLAIRLRPTSSLEKALALQEQTRQARYLLSLSDALHFRGAVDMRPFAEQVLHQMTLEAANLLAIRNTLIVSRETRRFLLEKSEEAPVLAEMAVRLSDGHGLIDLINKTINERGEVLDSASPHLGQIRSDLKITYARLMERMNRYLTDPGSARMLQESLITQRGGRYVIPLKAEHKGQIKSIVHDQSSSGATLFVEPLAVVEWNNKYRQLELDERDEILRVLHSLSGEIAGYAEELIETSDVMAELDLIFMKARYADDLHASEPELVAFEKKTDSNHPGSVIHLLRARHPLLAPDKVVPIDVELDRKTFAVVLTGPNTGGKTVTLKTIGLMVLMAQAGLQIPVRSGSRISVFQDVFADIGDEQSIEQSLSTFSGHITQLVHILKRANSRSLVLLDELGSGTDPQEGSALARAVLDYMLKRQMTCVVATHFPELKSYAHATPGVINASLEFDPETLMPTYRLMIGLPGRSNALSIAERLGLEPEILDAARKEINPDDLHVDDLLEEIHRQRNLANKNFIATEKALQSAQKKEAELEKELEKIENERDKIMDQAHTQAEEELEALRDQVRDLQKVINRLRTEPERKAELAEVEEKLVELEQVHSEKQLRRRKQTRLPHKPTGPIQVGQKVVIKKLGVEGTVTAIEGDQYEVQAGAVRLRLSAQDINRKNALSDEVVVTEEKKVEKKGRTTMPSVAEVPMELDLRGLRVEDALDRLDQYLEHSFSAGLPFGRIIHGKGTGALRETVRDTLRHSTYVSRWERGGETEGGDGVSVVFFQNPN
ncbi:MAG: endonuclease MutS2 [Anaerolineaceae bacterium]|jgi:DNA mismatch repair protein MutS2